MFYGHAMFTGGNSQKGSRYLSFPVYRCRVPLIQNWLHFEQHYSRSVFNFYFFGKKNSPANVLKRTQTWSQLCSMNPKAGEHRCSELNGFDVGISARYHWSVARQLTSYSPRHWNLRNLTLQQECYLTNSRDFFRNTHGSIMLPPRLPCVFARLGSLAINVKFQSKMETHFLLGVFDSLPSSYMRKVSTK